MYPPIVIAFDLFNTLVDLNRSHSEDVKQYANHLRKYQETGEWQPLDLPKSWANLRAFPDVKPGLERLRKKFICVTLSNGPVHLQIDILRHNNLHLDYIIPLEAYRVFKPAISAYQVVDQLIPVDYSEIMIVTANKDFGDLEAADKLGMQKALLRHEEGLTDLYSLAALLNC